MDGRYLIPANTSRGKLIFGLFRPIDLGIFLTGIGVTFILLMIIPLDTTIAAVIALLPVLLCSLLVAPLPHFHNVLVFIGEAYDYFTSQQRYKWKGWCMMYGTDEGQVNRGVDQRLAGNQQRNDTTQGSK